ncbi:MAG: type II secretion system protein [Patescibacteria group bacterium]
METSSIKNTRNKWQGCCHLGKFKNLKAGMTYVELIIVLSIFSVMTSVVLFDYRGFQGRVDVKVLANDIALQIVEAQRSSMSGKLNLAAGTTWKPSYGLRFNLDNNNNKRFVYFVDLDNNGSYTGPTIGNSTCNQECLDKIDITKGNFISSLRISGTGCPATTNNITITFKRPSSLANIKATPSLGPSCKIEYVAIDVVSPNALGSTIKVYSSGRIDID